MAWKKGTKLIFSKDKLESFPAMKDKLATFVERHRGRGGLIFIRCKGFNELWHKSFWRRRRNG